MTRRSIFLLGGITTLGAILRVTSPGRIGLWRDEVQALNIAGLPGPLEITRFLYLHESHPPLFYFLEHFAGRLTGDGVGVMSALVLLASIALIPSAWWLASLSQVRGAAAAAAGLVAVSIPHSFFSVQLRPYPLFSLLVMVGTAAMVHDGVTPSRRWKALWAGMALGLMYLHHAGTVVILAQLVTRFVFLRSGVTWRVQVRSWSPFLAVVALGVIPDVLMLLHQSSVAADPARHPIEGLQPLRDLWGMIISFPGEAGLALIGAMASVVVRRQPNGPGLAGHVTAVRTQLAAIQFLVVAGLLTLASYRSNLLTPQIVMSTASLGLVTCAIAIGGSMARMHR